MKSCPVCETFVFDDMEVCYGCMHCFSGDLGSSGALRGLLPEVVLVEGGDVEEGKTSDASPAEESGAGNLASVLDQSVEPGCSPSRGWVLRVEMRDPCEPTRFWTMELTPPSEAG